MDKSDSDIISKAFQGSLSEVIGQILPITDKGITNRVYVITTISGEKYVARLNDLSHFEEFKKELWASSKARAAGVVTPQILKVELGAEITCSIQEYIEGIHGTEYKSVLKIWYDLGLNARLIHSISTNGFGDRIDEEGNFQGSWDKYLDYNIESLMEADFLIQEKILTQEQSVRTRELFEQFKNCTFAFGLVHGDLSLKNSIVDNQEKTWIIDWGSAHSHIVPHYDFVEILQSSIDADSEEFRSFLKGYGYTMGDFDKISKEVYSLMLLRAVDKVRWAKDRRPKLLGAKINTLKKVLTISASLF